MSEPTMPHYRNAADDWFEQWVKDNPGALIKRDPAVDSLPFARADNDAEEVGE